MEDSECSYSEAEIDQIACYEEKKLLIQHAEERCEILKNQLDYLRVILTNSNYYQLQDEEMRDVLPNSPGEDELDDCSYLKISDMLEENRLNSSNQLHENFSHEKCDASEDEHSIDGVFREMEVNTDKEKLNEQCESTALDDKTNVSHFYPSCDEDHGQGWYTMKGNFECGDLDDELTNSKQELKKRKGEKNENRTYKFPKNLMTGSRVEKEVFLEKDTTEQTKQSRNEQTYKLCDANYKSTAIKRDQSIKKSNVNECLKNYRRPIKRTTSIISVSTVPSSNFKKESEMHFPTAKDRKMKKLSMITERSIESKPEFEKNNIIPPQSLRNVSYHQKAFHEKISASIPASKTGSRARKQFDNNECGDYVAEKPKKRLSSKSSSIDNSRQNLSMQWKIWTDKAKCSERLQGKSKKAQSVLNTQPISIHIFNKTSSSSQSKSKEKEKVITFENKEKNNEKTRVLRNGFGLHTIASKLKMSERTCNQKQSSKYPFIVGKATTPSHNLVLNIQQTLSIIKMKPSAVKSQTLALGAIEYKDQNTTSWPCITTSDGQVGSTLTMDPVPFVPSGSSVPRIQNCPLINQTNITTCIIQKEILETHDWYLFQEKYGDATRNKCLCYPRNCTNYYKVINHYLHNEEEIQFSQENKALQPHGQLEKFRRMDGKQGETMRERLAQVLRQVQNFQWMLIGKQGM